MAERSLFPVKGARRGRVMYLYSRTSRLSGSFKVGRDGKRPKLLYNQKAPVRFRRERHGDAGKKEYCLDLPCHVVPMFNDLPARAERKRVENPAFGHAFSLSEQTEEKLRIFKKIVDIVLVK